MWLNYHKLFGWPALVAINVADTALALEQLTDAEVVSEGMAALRQIYPAAPEPIQANVTRWAADPLARGAYRCETKLQLPAALVLRGALLPAPATQLPLLRPPCLQLLCRRQPAQHHGGAGGAGGPRAVCWRGHQRQARHRAGWLPEWSA